MTTGFLRLLFAALSFALLAPSAAAQSPAVLLPRVYEGWRTATVRKDYGSWQRLTSSRRQTEVRNRLLSAKAPFPQAIFDTPAAPPSLKGLKLIKAEANKQTARLTFYGPVDFGVGGEPTNNLYVISYVEERGTWKYDGSAFVNLIALPEVRAQLAKGDLSYLQNEDFRASGRVELAQDPVQNVRYVAKVYSFCPGRIVDVRVNRSKHSFRDTQDAQVIIGGAKDGRNTVSFTTRRMDGSTGKEAFTVRVYLMNENGDEKPVKVYEYLVNEGGSVSDTISTAFSVSPDQGRKVLKR